jgi:hypothetical protein
MEIFCAVWKQLPGLSQVTIMVLIFLEGISEALFHGCQTVFFHRLIRGKPGGGVGLMSVRGECFVENTSMAVPSQ